MDVHCVRCQLQQAFPDRVRLDCQRVSLTDICTLPVRNDWMEPSYWFGARLDTTSSKNDFCYMSLSVPWYRLVLWESRFNSRPSKQPSHFNGTISFRVFQLIGSFSSRRNSAPAVWITSCDQPWIVGFSEDIFVHKTKLGNFKEGDNVSFGVWPPGMQLENHTQMGGLTVITWLHSTVPT